jgi:hypothetical protein
LKNEETAVSRKTCGIGLIADSPMSEVVAWMDWTGFNKTNWLRQMTIAFIEL